MDGELQKHYLSRDMNILLFLCVVRFIFGMTGKGGGQNRKIDRPHGIESQKRAGYKFEAGFVPR